VHAVQSTTPERPTDHVRADPKRQQLPTSDQRSLGAGAFTDLPIRPPELAEIIPTDALSALRGINSALTATNIPRHRGAGSIGTFSARYGGHRSQNPTWIQRNL
jgi:hypothetical protein